MTNSDNRVPGILLSLGLRGNALRYESGRLGGEKGRSGLGGRDEGSSGGGGSNNAVLNKDEERAEQKKAAEIAFVALSYDVGVEKPHRKMFDAARCLAGGPREGELRADECVHIGDDTEKDYWGARDAGWGAVLVRREGKERGGSGGEEVGGRGVKGKGDHGEEKRSGDGDGDGDETKGEKDGVRGGNRREVTHMITSFDDLELAV